MRSTAALIGMTGLVVLFLTWVLVSLSVVLPLFDSGVLVGQ